jgi:hypothetical protein
VTIAPARELGKLGAVTDVDPFHLPFPRVLHGSHARFEDLRIMASVRFPADAANRCAPSRVLWTAVAQDPARRLRLTCKSPISGPASQRARGFFSVTRAEGLEEPPWLRRVEVTHQVHSPRLERARGFLLLGRVGSSELEGRNPGKAVRGRMGGRKPSARRRMGRSALMLH